MTDFGTSDPYIAMMKGEMLRINRDLQFIDICHNLPSFNIEVACLFLANTFKHFPTHTIHLVVIDPGVGTVRSPIILETYDYIFVAPDNGVLSEIYKHEKSPVVYEIDTERLGLDDVSHTFHGRDIFAPVAARLAEGTAISDLGTRRHEFTLIDQQPAHWNGREIIGDVLHIDHFGNIFTSVSRQYLGQHFTDSRKLELVLNSRSIPLCNTYGDVTEGMPVALFNSINFVEIAVHKGNAAEMLLGSNTGRADIRIRAAD
jgi:S-adenosylmethionine hydrolase